MSGLATRECLIHETQILPGLGTWVFPGTLSLTYPTET